MYLNKYIKITAIIAFLIFNIGLTYLSFPIYPGSNFLFLSLFLISNSYIYYSYKFSGLFLDKTLSIFLWLGFFYKLCVITIFNTSFPEGGGAFSYSSNDFDNLLKFSSIGILSFLIASILFNKIIKLPKSFQINENNTLLLFYRRKRYYIFVLFFTLILFVGGTNFYLGFYQKGLLQSFEINFYLGAFLKWMLLFGLTSISCLVLEYELKVFKKLSIYVLFLFFFELAFTNLSLLSRSMIFGGSAVIFSIYLNYEDKILKDKLINSLILNFSILFIIFALLIFPINKIRNSSFIDALYTAKENARQMLKGGEIKNIEIRRIIESNISDEEKIEIISRKIVNRENQILELNENIERIIFVIKNRFVGLDGVAAVTSYPKQNFDLFKRALKEEFNPNLYGFYQRTFVIPFENNNEINYKRSSERHYGIIIPGIISFLSYSGSLTFLAISLIVVHFFCSFIEFISRKLSFNSVIFSSFIGFVLGYRLIHFGYLPKQSYLILLAIILTIIIIFLIKYSIIKYLK